MWNVIRLCGLDVTISSETFGEVEACVSSDTKDSSLSGVRIRHGCFESNILLMDGVTLSAADMEIRKTLLWI